MNEPENYESFKEALKSYGLKQDIHRIHNEMMPGMPRRKVSPLRMMFSYAGKIAAGILIIIIAGGIFLYVDSTSENLFSSKYSPYETSAQRGNAAEASEIKTRFEEGERYLREGDPQRAILILAEVIGRNSRLQEKILNDDAEYYLALAYLDIKEPGLALPVFQKIHDDPRHLYHDEVSDWYLLKVKIASWKNK